MTTNTVDGLAFGPDGSADLNITAPPARGGGAGVAGTGASAVVPALPYHRLAHLNPATARWWRPLLVVLLTGASTFAGFVVVLVGMMLVGLAPGVPAPTEMLDDPRNPTDMVIGLGIIAVALPATVLAFRWAGGRRGSTAGTLHSVAGRFRWGMFGRAALVVVPIITVVNVALTVLFPAPDFSVPVFGSQLVAVYVAVVLLTPVQCAAEEYLFRGLPAQVFGTWLRSPLWGIVLPVPLFMAGHGYDWSGQVDVAVFALCMGFLTWKTGGLELPILVHTANNLSLFLMAPFSPTSLQQGETEPLALLVSLPMTIGITVGLSVWVSRREGLGFWEPVRGRGPSPRPSAARD